MEEQNALISGSCFKHSKLYKILNLCGVQALEN